MKYHGATIDYECERADDLRKAYNNYCDTLAIITPQAMEHIVNLPAARFYVSCERASIVISRMLKGDKLNNMLPTKKEMYYEIFTRFIKLKIQHPHSTLTQLVSQIINQPAPKFYLTPSYARIIMYKHKDRWKKEILRKLLRSS